MPPRGPDGRAAAQSGNFVQIIPGLRSASLKLLFCASVTRRRRPLLRLSGHRPRTGGKILDVNIRAAHGFVDAHFRFAAGCRARRAPANYTGTFRAWALRPGPITLRSNHVQLEQHASGLIPRKPWPESCPAFLRSR